MGGANFRQVMDTLLAQGVMWLLAASAGRGQFLLVLGGSGPHTQAHTACSCSPLFPWSLSGAADRILVLPYGSEASTRGLHHMTAGWVTGIFTFFFLFVSASSLF